MNRVESKRFEDVLPIVSGGNDVLFVFSCGYERRSLALFKKFSEHVSLTSRNVLAFTYDTFKTVHSRPENEAVVKDAGIDLVELNASQAEEAWKALKAAMLRFKNDRLIVILDYSSMPRNWYCTIAYRLLCFKGPFECILLYSRGRFNTEEYPCVGYGEFSSFSGAPKLTRTKETHIFGLGFDSIRTYGIWSYLDPQRTISVVARSKGNLSYLQRVYSENPEVISASEQVLEIPFDDFRSALSQLVNAARECANSGDCALVPDGPKPLILAMSLVPLFLRDKGVYCWHIGHVRPLDYEPLEVRSDNVVYCFSIIADEWVDSNPICGPPQRN